MTGYKSKRTSFGFMRMHHLDPQPQGYTDGEHQVFCLLVLTVCELSLRPESRGDLQWISGYTSDPSPSAPPMNSCCPHDLRDDTFSSIVNKNIKETLKANK